MSCFHFHSDRTVFSCRFWSYGGERGGINLIISGRWVARTIANQNHRNGRGDWCWCGPVGAVLYSLLPLGAQDYPIWLDSTGILVHGPSYNWSSGGPSAPQHKEPGGWLSLSKSWKPLTHSMKQRKQKVYYDNGILLSPRSDITVTVHLKWSLCPLFSNMGPWRGLFISLVFFLT